MPESVVVERLARPVATADLDALARLLAETVNDGAAVSFLPPLAIEAAADWWRDALADERVVVLVARAGDTIVGTVQVIPSWAPNQPHRGDVAKMMVAREARGRGIGAQLIAHAESAARELGLRLLVLDTRRGDVAERLYRRAGWVESGCIPDYALSADGTLHDTVIFHKALRAEG